MKAEKKYLIVFSFKLQYFKTSFVIPQKILKLLKNFIVGSK